MVIKSVWEKLFVKLLNRTECKRFDKKEDKEGISFDKQTMEAMNDLPISQYIQRLKKAEHMLSTYVLPLTLGFSKSVLYPDNKGRLKFQCHGYRDQKNFM